MSVLFSRLGPHKSLVQVAQFPPMFVDRSTGHTLFLSQRSSRYFLRGWIFSWHYSFLVYLVPPLQDNRRRRFAVGHLLKNAYATLRADRNPMPSGFNIEDYEIREGSFWRIVCSSKFHLAICYLLEYPRKVPKYNLHHGRFDHGVPSYFESDFESTCNRNGDVYNRKPPSQQRYPSYRNPYYNDRRTQSSSNSLVFSKTI